MRVDPQPLLEPTLHLWPLQRSVDDSQVGCAAHTFSAEADKMASNSATI
ncbi:hypothetical protein BSU04_05795 [Caballeronia sordidicola]|uniref:Uncharacterized protein n=1 Tax=Caballeronia sordidicola TaxID=196367 RepID=A0A226X847_CABSO|nr:hypothetical protein BSU04_05795 [Caballeronia sordidicola]